MQMRPGDIFHVDDCPTPDGDRRETPHFVIYLADKSGVATLCGIRSTSINPEDLDDRLELAYGENCYTGLSVRSYALPRWIILATKDEAGQWNRTGCIRKATLSELKQRCTARVHAQMASVCKHTSVVAKLDTR